MATPLLSRDAILRQLERVRESGAFQGASRAIALLTYVVEATADGRTQRLKEYTLGAEALARGPSFDPRTDPIVRAEASRLRRRLEQYYASEGTRDDILITLPKGSHVPRFEARTVDPPPLPAAPDPPRPRLGPLQRLAWFALGALTVGGGLAFSARALHQATPTPPRVVPLTALPGLEVAPSFSPDGRYVAFSWGGERGDNRDIYVKLVGASELRRVTSDPAMDLSASWSPDGRRIAFLRAASPGAPSFAVHVVSPLGGPDRKVRDWPAAVGPLSWSADGRALAVARSGAPGESAPDADAVYLFPVDGGEPRPLTRPHPSGRDRAPALSPDGRRLAYAACETRAATPCDVYVVELGPGSVPLASPHRVTRHGAYSIQRIAWTPDGSSIVYDAESDPQSFHLWRVAASGSTPPERIEVAGSGARFPALWADRLAFTRFTVDPDIVRFAPGRPRQVFAASPHWEGASSFSPDGRRVVFESMRSGERQEIWRADADGANPTQLTNGPGRMQGSPAWSPDGGRVAFDSQGEDGHWDVWTMAGDGGDLVRLTRHPGDENVPSWSRDGRWVYYRAQRTGREGIFRVPATGGEEESVLSLDSAGVPIGEESADGRLFLYTTAVRSPLFAHPLAGGPRRQLGECVFRATKGFVAVAPGVYYAGCAVGPGESVSLRRLDTASGEDVVLGPLERFRGHLAVSPDGENVLYSSLTRVESDLVLVEGFR